MASDPSNGGGKNANKSDNNLASLLKSMGGGDDCDRPACDDTKSALTAALQRVGRAGGSSSSSSSSSRVGGQDDGGRALSPGRSQRTKHAGSAKNGLPNGYGACPPTRDEIGASTWSLLHSMAAWYPNKPSSEDERSMSNFMISLARFYPCTWCAKDFQENVKLSPPRTETRDDLCVWLCEQHNTVNEKLGKPMFPCIMDKLDERWRKSGNPDCQK